MIYLQYVYCVYTVYSLASSAPFLCMEIIYISPEMSDRSETCLCVWDWCLATSKNDAKMFYFDGWGLGWLVKVVPVCTVWRKTCDVLWEMLNRLWKLIWIKIFSWVNCLRLLIDDTGLWELHTVTFLPLPPKHRKSDNQCMYKDQRNDKARREKHTCCPVVTHQSTHFCVRSTETPSQARARLTRACTHKLLTPAHVLCRWFVVAFTCK